MEFAVTLRRRWARADGQPSRGKRHPTHGFRQEELAVFRACYAPFLSGLACWHPCRDASVISIVSGGVARSSLNRQLHAGKPPASEAAFSRQVHDRLSQRLYGLATPITPTAMRSPALPA